MKKIAIKSTTGMGRTYTFDIDPSTTLKQLKQQFLHRTGNPDDEKTVRLVYKNEILYEDEQHDYLLSAYGVEDDSLLQAVNTNSRSCGFRLPTFVDISNGKGLVRKDWGKDAPDWRIASPGLCLEGVCQNKSCKAYQQRVIMSMGFIRFNITVDPDADTTKCPSCQAFVNPTTCAFSNCWWKYSGKKQEGEKAPEKCSCDWQYADNAYHYFDETKSGTVTWKELIVETTQNKPD